MIYSQIKVVIKKKGLQCNVENINSYYCNQTFTNK